MIPRECSKLWQISGKSRESASVGSQQGLGPRFRQTKIKSRDIEDFEMMRTKNHRQGGQSTWQKVRGGLLTASTCLGLTASLFAQPSATEALRLEPMQSSIDYDNPDNVDKCKIAAETGDGTAWVVRGPSNEILRRFVDSNGDNKVDQWRYYRSGIEVYRDIDIDFNGKADQYRWLGTAGTRWGLDEDEDGKIDSWKVISAEEVSAEVIESIKTKNKQRFQSVVLTANELNDLGLGKKLKATIAQRNKEAVSLFDRVVKTQKVIIKDTEWIDFGGLRPGTIPAGTDGSTSDVTVYENVVAMVESGGKPAQVPIGTLVKLGDSWRVVGLPLASSETSAPQFIFFEGAGQQDPEATEGVSEATTKLVTQLQKIDEQLAKATRPRDISKINELRADTLEKLANESTRVADRDMWWMQFADTVGTAAQSGTYPKGTRRLKALRTALERSPGSKELLSHVTFAHMSAEYAEQLQAVDVEFADVQEAWLVRLESFIGKFPKSTDAPEAMLQLALAKEFAGEEKDANRWYTKIVKDFSKSPLAFKAAGAKRRLECVGKPLALKGRTVEGKPFDIARLRGNVVLVHYWATWCQPCKQDMEIIKDLQKEFASEKFNIVGVNLDAQPGEVTRYFRTEKPRWTHLYEDGGLESRLAADMGVFTLPVMLLVDERGRVVNRQIHGAQLEKEIRKLLK